MGFKDKISAAQAAASEIQAKANELQAKANAKADAAQAAMMQNLTDSNGLLTFPVHEEGRNGNVKVAPGRLIRTIKKGAFKQDDTSFITYASIQSLKIERKLGKSTIVLLTATGTYRWKVTAAEQMKAAIEEQMFSQ